MHACLVGVFACNAVCADSRAWPDSQAEKEQVGRAGCLAGGRQSRKQHFVANNRRGRGVRRLLRWQGFCSFLRAWLCVLTRALRHTEARESAHTALHANTPTRVVCTQDLHMWWCHEGVHPAWHSQLAGSLVAISPALLCLSSTQNGVLCHSATQNGCHASAPCTSLAAAQGCPKGAQQPVCGGCDGPGGVAVAAPAVPV